MLTFCTRLTKINEIDAGTLSQEVQEAVALHSELETSLGSVRQTFHLCAPHTLIPTDRRLQRGVTSPGDPSRAGVSSREGKCPL